MKKSVNSVWDWPYCTKYYWTHPWVWFKHLGQNIRDAYRRARYGWTYVDVWNMDVWIMRTLPPMLRHMATHGSAYPGHEPFETPERWHEWLNKMADLLESGLEEKQNNCNEFYNEYIKSLEDDLSIIYTDENGMIHYKSKGLSAADHEYFNRAEEIAKDAANNVHNAMSQLGMYFNNLWN